MFSKFLGLYKLLVHLKYVLLSLDMIKEVQTWRAHDIGCPVYGMAYRKVSDANVQKDIPNRLFSSTCQGQIREWDPITGGIKNETTVTVRRYVIANFQQIYLQFFIYLMK